MKHYRRIVAFALAAFLLAPAAGFGSESPAPGAILIVQGKVLDSAGMPLSDASVLPYLNGKLYMPAVKEADLRKDHSTGRNGLFMFEIPASPGKIQNGQWSLKITRTGFRPSREIPLKILDEGKDKTGIQRLVATTTVKLNRFRGTPFLIALIVFIAVYVMIAFEIVHRTMAALLGAVTLLVITHTFGHFNDAYKVLTYEQALHAVDWNVIFLLMGMMIIVGVLKVSGVFQWLAYKSFQVAGGRIFVLASALCLVTAVVSAFLDNVTTMLLLTSVTMELALVLGVSPFVFLVPEIVASNFGGAATLIGDPPNIMIGSFAGLTFNDFLIHLTPVVIAVAAVQIVYNKWYYGADYYKAKVKDVPAMVSFLREKYSITDRKVLIIGGTVLIGVILMFILHGIFYMEVSVAALFGAAAIILLNRMDIVELLEKEVEWPTLVFFIMLFMVVGAAEQTGILQAIADWIVKVCGGNLTAAVLVILWVSGLGSAIVDNIPYTATMLPVIFFLNKTIPGADSGVLWWALALGACFGGNGSIIGASANVVTAGIAEKAGYKISFYEFARQAAPITVISLIISSAYLLIFY
ncbi:MAG: ArsB/NhaD family transporter [Desulfomonilaceae bacterium]